MGEEEAINLQDLVQDLVEVAPVEALPVDVLPVHAVAWFTRVIAVFARHAYLLAFAGALVENTVILGFLLPGGAVVALSAVGARTGGLSLVIVILLAAAGMTLGAVIDYLLGMAGIDRLLHHRRAGRLGRMLARQLEDAKPLLMRHGWWMMLIAHAFGHGRSSIAVAAGASRMPLPRFITIEVPAALLWSAVYAGGAYFLAAEWDRFELALRRIGWIGTGMIIAGLSLWWIVRRRHARPLALVGSPEPALHVGAELAQGKATDAQTPAFSNGVVTAPPAVDPVATQEVAVRPVAPETQSIARSPSR